MDQLLTRRQRAIQTILRGRCTIPDCGHPWKARGLCHGHYARLLEHGDPLFAVAVDPSAAHCPCALCRENTRQYQQQRRRQKGAIPREEWLQQARRTRQHGRASYNRGCRCDRCRSVMRDHMRAMRGYGVAASLHDRLPAETGIYRARGFGLRRCKCGCGLVVNGAQVVILGLADQGLTLRQIAARLDIPYETVRWLKTTGNKQSWAWYRKGHQRRGMKDQPLDQRWRVPRHLKLEQLIWDHNADAAREEKGHLGPRVAGSSLDAPVRAEANSSLGDFVADSAAAPETVLAERWIERVLASLTDGGFDLEQLADRCVADPALAAVLAECMETGTITAEARRHLAIAA